MMNMNKDSRMQAAGQGIRWFYAPNEMTEGDQVGPRKAFRLLHEQGVFSGYCAYSYLVERTKASSHRQALENFIAAAEAFQPDVIFIQHLNGSYPVDREFVRRLKSIASKPKFIWHDPEAYGKYIKPVDDTMKAAIAESDMAVIKGLGDFAGMIRKAGARRMLFSPESFDDERFGQLWQPTLTREYDAIMIANLSCLKRIPFLFMPGGRSRKTMARCFHQTYGERFGVFGSGQGWQGEPYSRGPIAFNSQESVMRTSWLSINWSIFDEIPFYFSDRLPISMATGIPHITNHQRGFEHLFPGAKGVYFVHSPEEALDVADYLLSMPRDHLIEIGQQGAEYARTRFNATRVYGDMVTAIVEQMFAGEQSRASHFIERGDK